MPAVREVWADGPTLFASMARHWLVVAVVAGVLGVGAYLMEAQREPVFETAAQLEFGDVQQQTLAPDQPARGGPARQLHNRMGHMRSRAVLERAGERLDGGPDVRSIRNAIEIAADPDRADAVSIIARGRDPEQVAAIANAVAAAYQEAAADRERERQEAAVAELDDLIERLQTRLELLEADADAAVAASVSLQRRVVTGQFVELMTRRERLASAAATADAGVSAYEPAPPGEQTAPNPARMGALGAFLGLALGSAYAYWREGRAGAARFADDVRGVLQAPLLAQLPKPPDHRWRWGRVWHDVLVKDREPYQFLGVTLDRTLVWLPSANILVTGVRPRRSTAAVAMNTAVALCQDFRRVVLVDADLRNRRLTSLWRLGGKLGLADLNKPLVSVGQTTVVAGTGRDSSWSFMPAGVRPRDPFVSLRGPALHRALGEFEGQRTTGETLRVVLHAPALLEAADASVAAGMVDGVVLVVFRGTHLDEVARAREIIDLAGGRLLGFVFVSGRRPVKRQPSVRRAGQPSPRRPAPVP